MPEPVRLSRHVAELFACTREQAEQYIRNGWVKVDGVVVESPQLPIAHQKVELDTQARLDAVEPATILLHKPVGFDAIEGAQPASALVKPVTHWGDDPSGIRPLERHFHRLTPLVPLEHEASGLMVLTQDGRVWRRLTEDADEIEHEYLVEVSGEMSPYGIASLRQGLSLRGRAMPPCKASWQNETRLRIAIKAYRPGMVRTLCAEVGLEVLSIRRLRIGKVGIGKGPEGAMPPGAWRFLVPGSKF